MASPEVKVMALSNVYNRLMHFKSSGDCEYGHKHTFDHATLVSSGSVLYEVLDNKGNVVASKEFVAPNFVYVEKGKYHRITALEDNTVCNCIHAVKTMDGEIVDPDFLVDPVMWNTLGKMDKLVETKTGKEMIPLVYHEIVL